MSTQDKKEITYVVDIVQLDELVKHLHTKHALLGGYAILYSKREIEGHMNWHGFIKPEKLMKKLGTSNFELLIKGQREFVISK